MMSSPDLMSNVSSMITTSRLTPAHTTLLGCNLLHLAASESTGEALRIVSSLFSKAELKAAANVRENQEHPSNLLEDTEGVAPLLWGGTTQPISGPSRCGSLLCSPFLL